MNSRSLSRRAGSAVVALALSLALAPGASAHGLSYPDRFDGVGYPDYGDMRWASIDHWVERGPFPASNPPVVLEHSVTAAAVASDRLQEPMFLIRAGSSEYDVTKAGVKRVSDRVITGPAQYSRNGATLTLRFRLSAIGSPSSYEWFGILASRTGTQFNYDHVGDDEWHSHTVGFETEPLRPPVLG
jgi:hypothetical protein